MENKILLQLAITATTEPIISYLCGFFLYTILHHIIEEIMKIPPYAACTLPKWDD
ncbi:MAG TPA: hypothetical protein VIY98_13050 [Nitrososphaeraceae archaeon]